MSFVNVFEKLNIKGGSKVVQPFYTDFKAQLLSKYWIIIERKIYRCSENWNRRESFISDFTYQDTVEGGCEIYRLSETNDLMVQKWWTHWWQFL